MTRLGITYDGIDYEAEDAHARLIAILPRALPQIVAVVEAAELMSNYPDGIIRAGDPAAIRLTPTQVLGPALTALEEALS